MTVFGRACRWVLSASVLAAAGVPAARVMADDTPIKVTIDKSADGNFQLMRDGKPYFIMGAGGDASKPFLKELGGNSFRTWGADDIDDKLDEANKLGMTVTVGIWMGHENQHFNYDNEKAVKKQFERAKSEVEHLKNKPALLAWTVGNEMEGYKDGGNPKIWAAVEDVAKMIHQVDPNHPVGTIIAEIGGKRVESINSFCPDIDFVGINSYGGGPSLSTRYRAGGGVKPFVITEFGPPGTWEIPKNKFGTPVELTSTAKGPAYKDVYEKSVLSEKGKLCLGSYAFAWGAKQEATATWFGLFLPGNNNQSRLEATDVLSELWTGKPVANRCPQVQPLTADKEDLKPGDEVHIKLDVKDPEGDPLTVKWKLYQDPAQYDTGGETQPEPQQYPDSITQADLTGATLKMPTDGGGFWLYAFVYDNHGGAAVANIPLHSDGPIPKPKATVAQLPLVLFGPGTKELPYVWSGWINPDAVGMDEKSTVQPHVGETCMMCTIKKAWGGIIWQSPANDWGKEMGGFNLTGAKALTFWARGDKGGEKVQFKYGVLGKDAKFPDSAGGHKDIFLTTEWKQYSIDVSGRDLSCIKTGFGWSSATKSDEPVVFYLSEIQYTTTPPDGADAEKKEVGKKAEIPFTVYADGMDAPPYVWSGWMGDAASIGMDEKCTDNPHSGATCMKCEFKSEKGFGGIVWQSPANDWGDQPGGFDLTGAKKLTFWARGDKGGEKVDFKLGVIGDDKQHHDSASAQLPGVTLDKDWKQYEIDLTGKDLSDIKTGFVWVLAAKGEPVTFYLDDIKYE